MSSNTGGSSSSRKEKEVIEQQRKLAALLAKKTPSDRQVANEGSGNKSGTDVEPKSSSASSLHRKAAAKPSPPPPGNKPPANVPKRPTRPTLKRPNSSSAASILVAARARAADSKPSEGGGDSGKAEATSHDVIEIYDSPKLQRKLKSAEGRGNRLASLVKNATSAVPSAGGDPLTSAAFGSNVSPEDFWKNIRDWDFVSDLASQANGKEETALAAKKPIPETFISFRHYISLWAPLCLAETRAQLLSEILTSSNQTGSRNLFTPVEVETTWKSRSGGRKERSLHTDLIDMDACTVKLMTRERKKGSDQYYANDVFCLIPTDCKDTVELLLKGKPVANTDNSFKRFCLVGHTEVQRKEINGLVLKVSKRKWAQVGTSSMYLLRIGGNITALREFTALCGVETIPLKRYLLGHHLEGANKNDSSTTAIVAPGAGAAGALEKQALLKKMGGVQALGKGFTEYAERKFNPSQLMAISASSHGCAS